MNLAIFDIDGTLTNTNDIDTECFVRALEQACGFSDVNTDWSQYTHTTDSAILYGLFTDRLKHQPTSTEVAGSKKTQHLS